jgi:phosphatidylinositol alpha-mannosyltransferase
VTSSEKVGKKRGDAGQPVAHPTVLFVSISGWLAGPGRSLLTLLSYFPSGVERVLAAPAEGDLVTAARARRALEVHLPLPRRPDQRPDLPRRVLALAKLTFWILWHRRRLVAIHANGFTELNLAAPGAVLARVPVVAWLHGSQVGRWNRRLGAIWRRLLPCHRLVAVSGTARRIVAASGLAAVEEVEIVPNPIDPEDVRTPASAGADVAGRSLAIGYLGGTVPGKGFDLLPAIVERLRDAPVRWLLFLSPPTSRLTSEEGPWAALDEASGGRVSFMGRASDVREAYRQCDVVICPSLQESFGRVAAEAMANGLPVVATDIEPFRDLLGDEEAGLLFSPGDADGAARAIRRLIDEPHLRVILGEAGRIRSAAFEPGPIVARLIQLYGLGPGNGARGGIAGSDRPSRRRKRSG